MSQYLSPWFTRRVRNLVAQIKVFFRLTITAGDNVQQVHKSLLDILFLLEAVTKTLLISNIIGEKRSNFHYDAPEYIFVNIGLYPLTMISSAISGKYACFTSISSACILTNTLQLHFTSTPVTAFSSIPSHLLHTPVHFVLQCLYSRQYPRIYAMRPSGENPRPSQPHQHLLDQGIAPLRMKKKEESPDEFLTTYVLIACARFAWMIMVTSI